MTTSPTISGAQPPAAQPFWQAALAGFSTPTAFAIERMPDAAVLASEARRRASRSPAGSDLIAAFGRSHGLTLETLALGAWACLLSRYSLEDDVVVGLLDTDPVPGGTRLLPIRVQVPPDAPVAAWLQALQSRVAESRECGGVPYPQIRQWSAMPASEPLASSILTVGAGFGDLRGDVEGCPEAACPLFVRVSGDAVEIEFDSRRFESAAIDRMLGHLQTLLAGFAAQPQAAVSRLPLLTAGEQHQILVQFNQTEIDFPDVCLHELFEAQAARSPEAIAVIFRDQRVTYAELNRRANQWAHYLQSLGVGPDMLVGMFVERSVEMVVGLLAILKAGGAYVPLDPAYPADRLAFMLGDTKVSILLTLESLAGSLPAHEARVLRLDADRSAVANCSGENPTSGATPDNLAYVIYTSGSTGNPKGAVLNHRGRVNNFCDFNSRYSVGVGDRLLALSSLSFDMSAYDTFGTLACGATMVVPEPSGTPAPGRWAQLMIEHQITVWHSVPALLEMLVDQVEGREELFPRKLRLVLLGGDWIPLALPDRIRALAAPGVRVTSMGGATEVSMDSTIYEIHATDPSWKSIPYGAPMDNQLAYVLDRRLNPVPIGVPAELHLGGIGVGRGYLNRPELTAEKFIPNPFRPGERIYKTGDLARWGVDGNLELLGRMDFQVKIRGFRVELGEIEAAIRKHPGVRECVLLARQGKYGEKRLVAYLLPRLTGGDHARDSEDAAVANWQQVYDVAYGQPAEVADAAFNFTSWDSSYTGLPIPAEEMRVWVDSTVERIRALKPRRVLEIGCGLGLLLFRVAPECEAYRGTDISHVAIDSVSRLLDQRPLPQVTLVRQPADDFSGIAPGSVDTVILNSIVFDFPSPDYLLRVLKGAAKAIGTRGTIFVGDVRHRSLAGAFYTSVQRHNSSAHTTRQQLQQRIANRARAEEELLIDPDFFTALGDEIPEIGHVEFQLKRGSFCNEVNEFRYDVTLYVGRTEPASAPARTFDWQRENLSVESLRQQLERERPETVSIERVPNRRLLSHLLAVEMISASDGPATAGQLRRLLHEREQTTVGIDPEAIWELAKSLGYEGNLRFSQSGGPGCFDVFLMGRSRRTEGGLFPAMSRSSPGASVEFASNPLGSTQKRKLVPDLRRTLGERLPNYMVPSAFVVLEAFPLSPNGKINRRALPEPDSARPDLDEEFVPPQSALEQVVAGLWADVLDLDEVGVHDGFVDLGGSSLLATQVTARLQEIFPVDLPLSDVYRLTVSDLAPRLLEAGQNSGVDVAGIAEAWLQVSELSESDVQNLLSSGNSVP